MKLLYQLSYVSAILFICMSCAREAFLDDGDNIVVVECILSCDSIQKLSLSLTRSKANNSGNMGISEAELAKSYMSDEVGNVMGELMNQILGDFTKKVSQELQSSITQSQPKMLTLNRQVKISVDTDLVKPQSRRVSFYTEKNNIFYLELSMDYTEFIKLRDFDAPEAIDPDALLESVNNGEIEMARDNAVASTIEDSEMSSSEQDDLLASLGL